MRAINNHTKIASPNLNETFSQKAGSAALSVLKGAASAIAVGVISQMVYNSYCSPSMKSYNPILNVDIDPLNEEEVSKVSQLFYNTFETKGALFNMLGLESGEPFGDLQAYALSQNIPALNSAYESYLDGEVTQKMKNKLLGRVMRQMDVYQKDLSQSMMWLIDKGASINHQELKKTSELQPRLCAQRAALLTAYQGLDVHLFKKLLEKGASPMASVNAYNHETHSFESSKTIIEAIIDDIRAGSNHQLNNEFQKEYICPIYKDMIDRSFEKTASSLGAEDKRAAKVRMYMEISPYRCQNHFKVTESERIAYEANKLKDSILDAAKRSRAFFESLKNSYEFKEGKPNANPTDNDFEYEDVVIVEESEESCDDSFFKDAKDRFQEMYESDFVQNAKKATQDTFKKGVEGASKLKESISNGAHNIYHSDFVQGAGETAGNIGSGIKDRVSAAVSGSIDLVNQAYNSELASTFGQTATEIGGSIKDGIAAVGTKAGETIVGAVEGGADLLNKAYNSELAANAGEAVVNLGGNIADATAKGATAVKETFEAAINSEAAATAASGAKAAFEGAGEMAKGAADVVSEGVKVVAEGAQDAANSQFASDVSETLGNLGTGIKDTLQETAKGAGSVGGDVLNALNEGFQAASETVTDLTANEEEENRDVWYQKD